MFTQISSIFTFLFARSQKQEPSQHSLTLIGLRTSAVVCGPLEGKIKSVRIPARGISRRHLTPGLAVSRPETARCGRVAPDTAQCINYPG